MKKILKWFALILLGVFVFVIAAFAIWVNITYKAEPEKLAMATDEKANDYRINEKADYWEIIPNGRENEATNADETALIFYPGAKVAPNAYFYKLSALANGQAGKMKIFVTKPTLKLAVFSIDQADKVIADHPEIKKWIVGGHSLGGAMSCQYAANHADKIAGLWLFASYCGGDISQTNLKVLSIHGSLDGILTPQKIAENRKNLPPNATLVEIEGVNHAQFGNYGEQSGDNPPTKTDEDARRELSKRIKDEG